MIRSFAGIGLGLLLIAATAVPAAAEGRGEDVGIDLFLDTRDLLESGAGEAPKPPPSLSEAPKKSRKQSGAAQFGETPNTGPRWEWDPISSRRQVPGDPFGRGPLR